MTINDKICPLCGQGNGCMAHLDEPCWCNDVKVPQALLERVPEPFKRRACICRSCIEAFHKEP